VSVSPASRKNTASRKSWYGCAPAANADRGAPPAGPRYDLFHFTLHGVPVVQYRPDGFEPGRPPDQSTGVAFLDVVERACARFRPAVVLTYGGLPIAPHLIRRVRRQGARVVFALHNFGYHGLGVDRSCGLCEFLQECV
jgi:hypothetical protein